MKRVMLPANTLDNTTFCHLLLFQCRRIQNETIFARSPRRHISAFSLNHTGYRNRGSNTPFLRPLFRARRSRQSPRTWSKVWCQIYGPTFVLFPGQNQIYCEHEEVRHGPPMFACLASAQAVSNMHCGD